MNFIFSWIINSLVFLCAMSINNIFWINKGGEWYGPAVVSNSFGSWKGPVKDYSLWNKIKYAFKYRIVTVWSNWRDIVTAIIGGFILLII